MKQAELINVEFSKRAQQISSSAIREILKITEQPGVISFAGGLPSPAAFPIPQLREACQRVFANNPESAFQYSATEGYAPLRELIAREHGVHISQVLITTGSQQALDLLAKIFINSGDKVLVETPTYLGALQAFRMFEARLVAMPSDDEGIHQEALTQEVATDARLIYVLPNFQNPTGRQMSLARRQALMQWAEVHDVLVVEDDPYGALSYSGSTLPRLRDMSPSQVMYLGSFSKVLAPGLRLGYVVAPEVLIHKMVQAKQAADLHTSTFDQRVGFEVLQTSLLTEHLPRVRELYRARCEVMLNALAMHMPKGTQWNRPKGGMFVWVRWPIGVDSNELLTAAVSQGVAFVPGMPFYAEHPEKETLRLAFATVTEDNIVEGIRRLGSLVTQATYNPTKHNAVL